MKNETILKALRIVSKLETTVTDIPYTSNMNFTIFTDSLSRIPHYIKINNRNTAINLHIAIAGKRQACQTCGATTHWTSQCQVPRQDKVEPHTTANTTENDTPENAFSAQLKTPHSPESKNQDTTANATT